MNTLGRTPQPDAAELKRRFDLRPLAESILGEPTHRASDHDMYNSPWRDDHHRGSFAVYSDGYKDFGGDGESGDHYSFLMRMHGWGFREALQWLATQTGAMPTSRSVIPASTQHDSPNEPPSAVWQDKLGTALKDAQAYLWSNAHDAMLVRKYLREVRGLSEETIRAYGLGYNPQSANVIVPDSSKSKSEKKWIPPGILIPIESYGALWAVRVRCRVGNLARALQQEPDKFNRGERQGQEYDKYLSATGSKPSGAFFNGDQLVAGTDVLIVEGEFDAMLAQQALGRRVAVITLGSASSRLNIRLRDQLKQAGRVYLLFDEDRAGQGAAQTLATLLGEQAQRLHLPQGKDVTEFAVDHRGDLATWFDASLRVGKPSLKLVPSIKSYGWLFGVPDAYRSGVLNAYPESCSLVQELINYGLTEGVLDPKSFTANELLTLCEGAHIQISKRTLYSALAAFEKEFVRKLDTTGMSEDSASKSGKKAKHGRPAETWELLPIARRKQSLLARLTCRIVEKCYPAEGEGAVLVNFTEKMLEAVGCDIAEAKSSAHLLDEYLGMMQEQQGARWEQAKRQVEREMYKWEQVLLSTDSTPLPEDMPIKNAAGYRAAYLHGYVQHHPDRQLSHRDFERLLGIVPSSIKATCKRAGVKNIEQYDTLHIKKGDEAYIKGKIKRYGRTRRGFPLKFYFRDIHGQFIGSRRFNGTEADYQIMATKLSQHCQLEVLFQLCNRQEVIELPAAVEMPMAEPEKPIAAVEASLSTSSPTEIAAPSEPKTACPLPEPTPDQPRRTRRQAAYTGKSHDPEWVYAQLQLAFRLQGWVSGDHMIDVTTGELFTELPPPRVLVEILIEQAKLGQPAISVA